MTAETLNYEGPYYTYRDVPVELHPAQNPWPAFWYGSSNTTGATWAGEAGMHFTANGPTKFAKGNIDAYRTALAARGGAEQPKAEFAGGAAIGALRNVVLADTNADAMRIARPAAEHHLKALNHLRAKHGLTEFTGRLNVPRAATLEGMIEEGTYIVGAPETALKALRRQADELGTNYILTYMMFGDMALSDALRSVRLFQTEIMPVISRW
jgi:alkanesulfonate monooxygenase SsuD/methylene tetrahydromethanopterin reductase-like flavin-dependent oxidoreductase (luciferase family)